MNPALDRVDRPAHFLGGVQANQVMSASLDQSLAQESHRARILNLGGFAQGFPRALLLPRGAPAAREAAVAAQERCGASTVLPKRLAIGKSQGSLTFSDEIG